MEDEKIIELIDKKFHELNAMHDLFKKYAPKGALLDFIKRNDEYIVLYRDDGDVCTPYIIHHLNDSGLYYGRYYGKGWEAWMDFDEMKRYYGGMK